jgi:hypothetical protein
MNVQNVHENAELDSLIPDELPFTRPLNRDDLSIRRRNDPFFPGRRATLRVPEKPDNKQGQQGEEYRRNEPMQGIKDGRGYSGHQNKRDSLPGDPGSVPAH